jgi:uncharacterized membrane protein
MPPAAPTPHVSMPAESSASRPLPPVRGSLGGGPVQGSGGTSIGLSRRAASLLAYSAGWISGLLVLWFESRDREVRFHAAQSLILFGALTLIGAFLIALAFAGLISSLTLFRISLWAAQALIAVGVVLWIYAIIRVAAGGTPRWPVVAGRADRLAGGGTEHR